MPVSYTHLGILDASPAAYLTNPTALAMRAQRIEAGLRYKQDLWQNKCPVLQFALPLAGSSDDTAYQAAVKAWDDAVYVIVTESQSDEEVAQRWESLQRELTNMGLDTLEAVSYTHLDVYKRQRLNFPR